jgi:rare lipoprotein A (peptidoglycan hydrolase)
VLAGCGAGVSNKGAGTTASDPGSPAVTTGTAHPQAVEPVAGQAGVTSTTSDAPQPLPGAPVQPPSPNQPASVTGAPAKGAPTDAEVRAAIARFHAAIRRYHLDQLNLTRFLLDPTQLPPGAYHVSIASVFTDYGLPIACGGVLHVPQLGVANKTLPCGTEVIFRYGGRAIRVPVIDRGPYIPGREWDLTGATALALHFPGLGPIEWRLG